MGTPRLVTHSAVLAGYALGAVALYWRLPSEIPPSWTGPSGDVTWLGATMVAFLLPAATAVIDALLRGLCLRHPIDQHNTANALSVFDAIMARVAVFVLGVHAVVLAGLIGLLAGQEWAAQIVPLMLGITLISVGNLLPRTRPNLATGIRTQRTLSDRACWIRTHRHVGYLVVACGIVVVLSALAVPKPVGPGMILLVGPVALVGTWLLLRLQRRHAHA
jgi:immunity protein, SdpI family